MMAGIKAAQEQIGMALAIPQSMIHDEITVRCHTFAQMAAVDAEMRRAMRRTNIYLSDYTRGVVGLPPVSAVDRLGDLVKDDDGA